MTNRRSLKTADTRYSRAFQFVPGHVSGRVDSAQPVRRRRTVGAVARTLNPPTAVEWLEYRVATLTPPTSAPFPSGSPLEQPGATMILGFASTNVSATYPAGWTQLYLGGSGATQFWVGMADYDSSPSWDFIFDEVYDCGWGYALGYFTGGSGGTWTADEVSAGGSTGIDFEWGTADVGFQMFMPRGCYTTWIDPPDSGPYPTNISTVHGRVLVMGGLTDDRVAGTGCSFDTLGAYGTPLHTSLNLEWSP